MLQRPVAYGGDGAVGGILVDEEVGGFDVLARTPVKVPRGMLEASCVG